MRAPALLLLPILLFSSGCTLFESRQMRALRASPDYRAGYSDGCASAPVGGINSNAGAQVRDEAAWQENRAYRMGWGRGYGACRSSGVSGTVGGGSGLGGPTDRRPPL